MDKLCSFQRKDVPLHRFFEHIRTEIQFSCDGELRHKSHYLLNLI